VNDLVLFLASRPQCKEVVLLLGSFSDEALPAQICRIMVLEHLTVVTGNGALRVKAQNALRHLEADEPSCLPCGLQFLTPEEARAYQRLSDGLALCFDSPASSETVLQYASLSPAYVYGAAREGAIDAFYLWESFRKTAVELYIVCQKEKKRDILRWRRNGDEGIELSVIFPVYNVAPYLSTCIESVTQWEADYVEFLFVDDGSPDDSAGIIREYAARDPRIKLLQKENGGCASARQYGLDHARGSYIGFVDPDDYTDPTMYQKLFRAALTGCYEIAYCGYSERYEDSGATREIEDLTGEPYAGGTADPDAINALLCYLRVAIWRGIYSKDLLQRNHIHFYTDLRRFDDLPFKVEVFSKARSVVSVPEHLYYYRLSRPGQDVSADDERLYVHFPIFNYLDDFLRRSSDQRQLDYLQVVKVHTHKFALRKLRPEFFWKYCEKASKDLRSNFGFWEGAYIVWRKAGRRDLIWFVSLYLRLNGIVRLLALRNR